MYFFYVNILFNQKNNVFLSNLCLYFLQIQKQVTIIDVFIYFEKNGSICGVHLWPSFCWMKPPKTSELKKSLNFLIQDAW